MMTVVVEMNSDYIYYDNDELSGANDFSLYSLWW